MKADQAVIVKASNEEAKLLFVEKNENGKWTQILESPAFIGKNGLGKEREGDMKTPIGEYRFIKAFGILDNPGTRLDYTQVDESHYWVDDVNSTYYNQFVSTREIKADWNSAEHICDYGKLYHYVLATNYNEKGIPGMGSAVFLHCATENTKYTAGCIAIPEEAMKELLQKIQQDCVLIIEKE